MTERKERWIMVSDGTPQIFYVGKTDLDEAEIRENLRAGRELTLTETRAMRTIVLPTPQGVNQSNMLTPVSISRGGIRMVIRPVSWFWPDEDKEGYGVLLGQIEKCDGAELKHRAEKAGLTLAGNVNADGLKL
jgi:hypothetical protein